MTNLLNTDYVTLDNLLDSVKGDFKKYDEGGVIDDSNLYKIIALCNKKAGISINPIQFCVAEIIDGKIDLPENFAKIKQIHLIFNFKGLEDPTIANFYKNWTEETKCRPKPNEPIYTPLGCFKNGRTCYWVIPHQLQKTIKPDEPIIFTEYTALTPSHQLSPTTYIIDREEGIIKFPVKKGYVTLAYYADIDTLGLIPKNPLLYQYYEWTVKVKILQDILMNSEDDVSQKLQYAEKEQFGAYVDFDNCIKSMSFRKSLEHQKQQEEVFWNQYFKPFY